jgi:hypothetical protein
MVKIGLIGFMGKYPLEGKFTGHACRDVNVEQLAALGQSTGRFTPRGAGREDQTA